MPLLKITYTKKHFEVRFQFNEDIIKDIKSIDRSYWSGKDRAWIIPSYMEYPLQALIRKYGEIISDPVIAMPEQIFETPQLPELTIDLNILRKPFPFQGNGIARGLELISFINGDAPGLGKTTQAIATAIARKSKCILVICPNSLKLNWQKEWLDVAGMKSMILDDKRKTSWVSYYEVGMIKVFIVNYESLKKYFVQAGWKKPKRSDDEFRVKTIPFKPSVDLFDEIIVDESHNCKNGDTITTKLVMGICRGKKNVQLLTGTPVVNKPFDLISQLAIIDKLKSVVSHIPYPLNDHGKPTDGSGMVRFINRYCGGTERGATNLKELQGRLYKYCFFRREKKDVLTDLPDKTRQLQYCEISNWDEYKQAENFFIKTLKDAKASGDPHRYKEAKRNILSKIAVLKQIASRGKLEAAKEYIDEVINGGQKIVVFYHNVEILEELKLLYPKAVTISGEDDDEQRDRNKNKFQNDPDCSMILCSLKIAGVGLTLTAASEVLLVQQPWTDAAVEQAIDRLHRIGQFLKVRAGILLGKDTIDEWCYGIIERKRNIFNQVVGTKYDAPDEVVDDLLNFFDRRTKDLMDQAA